MANRDIAGLLTGIPSGGIDPTVNMSGNQMIALAASRAREGMGRSVRGLMGGDRRTVEERQIDKVKSQQKAFATYLSANYPNSGLDVLATEGVVTPANFKDFLAEKQGANLRQGKRYTVRDEEGNMFAASTTFSNVTGAFDTVYTPLGTTTTDSPVGDIDIITEAGVSFAEKEEAKIESAKQINDDKEFGKAQLEAVKSRNEIDANLIGLQESLELARTVKTGGPINNMTLSVQKFLGTTPADKAELEFRLASRMLSNLKSTFGGVISEGERNYLNSISPNINKPSSANMAILETLLEIQKRVKVRNDLFLSSRNLEEYKQTLMGYDFKDPVIGEQDEDENVIDFERL